jgi:hypothetical protein
VKSDGREVVDVGRYIYLCGILSPRHGCQARAWSWIDAKTGEKTIRVMARQRRVEVISPYGRSIRRLSEDEGIESVDSETPGTGKLSVMSAGNSAWC